MHLHWSYSYKLGQDLGHDIHRANGKSLEEREKRDSNPRTISEVKDKKI